MVRLLFILCVAWASTALGDKMSDMLIGRVVAPYTALSYAFNSQSLAPTTICSELLTGNDLYSSAGVIVFFSGAPQSPEGTPPAASASGWVPEPGASPWWEYDGTSFMFTVTPKMATRISSIRYWGRRSTQGPKLWNVYWSVDNYTTPINSADATSASYVNTGVTLEFKVPASRGAAPVTFKLVGYNATSEGGAWRIDDVRVKFSDKQGSDLCD